MSLVCHAPVIPQQSPAAMDQNGWILATTGAAMNFAAYSPQARGRSERSLDSWQSRLPQEIRLRGITGLAQANEFLQDEFIGEFTSRFAVSAAHELAVDTGASAKKDAGGA